MALRAHHAMITPLGELHPIVLTGYRADPGLPGTCMTDLAAQFGGTIVAATRADLANQATTPDPFGAGLSLWSCDTVQPDFNLYGTLLAVDLGFAPIPYYGNAHITRQPDDHGVINKLSLAQKDIIERKVRVFAHVLSGDLSRVAQNSEAYVQVMRLLAHLDRQHAAARGQVTLW